MSKARISYLKWMSLRMNLLWRYITDADERDAYQFRMWLESQMCGQSNEQGTADV